METFGEWLRQQRSLRRLTREELGKRVGCSVSLLRKIEVGERRPSAQIAELMANCLDIPPGERSTFVRVARGELNVDRLLPESKPADTSISSPKTKLPIFPTPLIGRQREVEQLRQLLGDPQCRLLTLVGPGGIGKTRLGIEAAAQVQDLFADGVYLVVLASANSTQLIVPVIADAIGFAFQSASPTDPKAQLFSYLKEKHALLLMDNLEQLLTQPGIEVLAELLANTPQVKLLTTSRAPLELQGEWVFEVQGLPIPERQYAEGRAQNTSVELFLQRGRRAHVGFDATPQDFPAIVRVCQLMEGNPLGIELAAGWVHTLSCTEIAAELERGLDFLHVSARDTPVRHRSLRAVFDHSWKLLTEEEQGILLRLSAFRGGFRREAAEAVAGATLSVLSGLVTKSLIGRSGDGRYDLHELIRQFAEARLEAEPQAYAETRERHCEFYLNWLHANEGALRGPAQSTLMQELPQQYGNLRLAWGWAVDHGRVSLIVQALRCFWLFCDIAGWFQEAYDQIERAIRAMHPSGNGVEVGLDMPAEIGPLWAYQAWFCFRLGQYGRARPLTEQGVRLLRRAGGRAMLAEALVISAVVIYRMGEPLEGRRLVDESLELAQLEGDSWTAAWALCLQGIISNVLGQYSEAHERLSAGLAGFRAIGDQRLTAFALNYLSPVAMTLGRHDEAQALAQESLELSMQLADWWGIGSAYCNLGAAAQARQDWAAAEAQLQRGVNTFRKIGARGHMAQYLARLGEVSMAIGDWAKARRVLLEAMRIDREVQALPALTEAAASLASLLRREGAGEQALQLALQVLDHAASAQSTKDRAGDLRAELEAQLTRTQIEAIQAHAREKTFEAIVENLLK